MGTDFLVVLLALLIFMAVLWLVYRHEVTILFLKNADRKRKDEFAIVSHQLRTPMTTIRWYAEMLLNQEYGNLKIAQLELLKKIDDSVSRGIDILNGYLEKARVERYGSVSQLTALDLVRTIDQVIDIQGGSIEDRSHTLNFEKPEGHPQVTGDVLLLHGIIDSILSNAILYTPANGVIRVSVEDEPHSVSLNVSDTGIGIPTNEQGLVFSEFFRSEKARLLHPGGSGLSLHIIKKMLEEMGGSIRFTSEEGKGTTFTISLPKAEATS